MVATGAECYHFHTAIKVQSFRRLARDCGEEIVVTFRKVPWGEGIRFVSMYCTR